MENKPTFNVFSDGGLELRDPWPETMRVSEEFLHLVSPTRIRMDDGKTIRFHLDNASAVYEVMAHQPHGILFCERRGHQWHKGRNTNVGDS